MKKIYCPVNGWTCPYFDANGVCMMDNPASECDDFAALNAFFDGELEKGVEENEMV